MQWNLLDFLWNVDKIMSCFTQTFSLSFISALSMAKYIEYRQLEHENPSYDSNGCSGCDEKLRYQTDALMTQMVAMLDKMHRATLRSSSSDVFTIPESTIFFSRNFLCSVFLQDRSFLLWSKMPIKLFIMTEKDTLQPSKQMKHKILWKKFVDSGFVKNMWWTRYKKLESNFDGYWPICVHTGKRHWWFITQK